MAIIVIIAQNFGMLLLLKLPPFRGLIVLRILYRLIHFIILHRLIHFIMLYRRIQVVILYYTML